MTEPAPRPEPAHCPTCRRPVAPENPATRSYFPFCSTRCQLIDLGKWLNEEYVISTPLADQDLPPAEKEDPVVSD